MSRKHADLEREFLADLEPRTGRGLAAWLVAIDETGLADRNAIIDWLRPQGLTFAHASWLERIHHNGGRPIYGDLWDRPAGAAASPEPSPVVPVRPAAPPRALRPTSAPPASPGQPPADRPAPMPHTGDTGLAELLARGKGLRPLAEMLLRELAQALPGLEPIPSGDLISLQRGVEFGVLAVGPRELKLGLGLGSRPLEAPFVLARIPGASERITHMMVLSDARQIGAVLIEKVAAAADEMDPPGP